LNHFPTADEVALLRRSAREALSSLYTSAPDEKWPESWTANWDTLAEQGLWSTLEPPDGSLAAAAVVAEELGRALYPGPACEALAASYVLDRLGDARALRAVADGSPPAVLAGADDLLVQVPPETLLIIATDQDTLFAAPAAEIDSCAIDTVDVSRRISRLQLRDRPVTALSSSDRHLARYGRAARRLLYCADALGCVDHVVQRTTDYARQRTTFGSPIGKYQAVAHRLVDHAITARQMRLVLYAAVAAFDDRAADLAFQVATTETFFWGRSADIISDCIQLTGAIGFTWELGHHFYLRRAVQNTSLGGGVGRPHQRLARESAW
jgi:alkylation response protein AidB-like acyl-CoA dehydrogenase